MDFSEDQARAFERMSALLAANGVALDRTAIPPSGEPGRRILAVVGRAGSGKTQILAELVSRLLSAGVEPISGDYESRRPRGARTLAVLAPTNKAASVLRRRGVPATTIHRILYTPLYDPEYELIAEWLRGTGERPESAAIDAAALDRARAFYSLHGSIPGAFASAGLRGSDFIRGWKRREEPLDIGLVDEASMLDERQLSDLRDLFSTLILFGDPAQLAPVGGSGRMVFEDLPEELKATLAVVHRQRHDNPILDLSEALADPSLSFEDFEEMVRVTSARDDRVVVAQRVDADAMARSPVLVWRNATRVRLIAAFRNAFDAPEDRLVAGEPLICDGVELPVKHRRKRMDLEARGLIKGAQAIYLGQGRSAGFSRVHVVGAEDPDVSVASIIQIEAPERVEPLIVSAARMGVVFLHGAAVTIHKAQGSQWPDVQVFAPDLYAAARSGRSEAGSPLWKRLAYVAITRAEERLIWVTRYRLGRPANPLATSDLRRAAPPLELRATSDDA